MDAIGECHIACEIIDNRCGDPMASGLPSLIADDFFQVGFVPGAEIRVADAGSGRSRRVHRDRWRTPHLIVRNALTLFDPLRWLGGALARKDLSLRAGQVVLTGTLAPPMPVSPSARGSPSVSPGLKRSRGSGRLATSRT
jgi:2-keto-4-pentenoate hydratase